MEIALDKQISLKNLADFEDSDEALLKPSPEGRVRRMGRNKNHFLIHPDADPAELWEIIKDMDINDRMVVEDFSELLEQPQTLRILTEIGHASGLRISDIDQAVTRIPIGEQ